MKLKVSKSQWLEIGKVGGWLKTANGFGRFSGDLSDVLEGMALSNKNKPTMEIVALIKADQGLVQMMQEEEMTDEELIELIEGTKRLYSWMK